MRIENCMSDLTSQFPQSVQPQGQASGSAESQSSAVRQVDDATLTPELQQLLAQVRQQPEVRTDLVILASQRVQQGAYLTPAAAAATAGKILDTVN